MLKEIEDQQRSLVVETDIRNVSPWLRITQWHEMFKDYDLKLLHSMVAPPSDVEFPNLQKSVLFTFKGASSLIDTMTTLVLQFLMVIHRGKNIQTAATSLKEWFVEKNESTFNSLRTLQHVASSIAFTTHIE